MPRVTGWLVLKDLALWGLPGHELLWWGESSNMLTEGVRGVVRVGVSGDWLAPG